MHGTEISWKSFQKFRKLLNFRNANHSTENFRNSASKVEWKENFREIFFENLGIPREVVLFFWKCSITGAVNRKMLFHSLLEVPRNSNRKVWLNGKRPMFRYSRNFSILNNLKRRVPFTFFFPQLFIHLRLTYSIPSCCKLAVSNFTNIQCCINSFPGFYMALIVCRQERFLSANPNIRGKIFDDLFFMDSYYLI